MVITVHRQQLISETKSIESELSLINYLNDFIDRGNDSILFTSNYSWVWRDRSVFLYGASAAAYVAIDDLRLYGTVWLVWDSMASMGQYG